MWGLLWQNTAELAFELAESVRSDGNMTFELVSDEDDFLYVSGKPLCLYLVPLLLLGIGTVLVEEHPDDCDEEDDVYP